MKRERILSFFWNWALSFSMSAGITGCLATAFEFSLPLSLLAVLAVLCAAAAALCSFRFGFLTGIAALAAAGFFLWKYGTLSPQLSTLVGKITKCYQLGYGWPVFSWTDPLKEDAVVQPFLLVGLFIALVTARIMDRRGRTFWIIAAAAPFISLCVVLNDTVPHTLYLALALFALTTLLMTQTLRRRNKAQANRLTAMLALPLILALTLLFIAVPREGYVPPEEDLAMKTVTWFQELDAGQKVVDRVISFISGIGKEKLSLKNTGPRGQQKYKVMEVTAESGGLLYLRGRAYDVYDGWQWQSTDGEWALDDDYIHSNYQGTVNIRTNSVHDVLYYPMATDSAVTEELYRGYLPNDDRQKEYSFPWYIQPAGLHTIRLSYLFSDDESGDTDIRSGAEDLMQELAGQYLVLPEDTRKAAEGYLRENMDRMRKNSDIINENSTYHIAGKSYALPACAAGDVMLEAAIVCELVKHSAVYDLNTRKMPPGESDFAMWFLNDSDTGYCVHFATATTVLLRAAGIPARYVEGYLVSASENTAVNVLGEDAHAWVEYWVPGYGWMMLEPTPGYGSGTPETTEPEETAPETTEPEETEPETSTRPDTPDPPERPTISRDEPTEPTSVEPPLLPGGDREGPTLDLTPLIPMLKWLAGLILFLGAVTGQWKLRLALWQRRFDHSAINTQALLYWQLLCRTWKALKLPSDEALEQLALKAKFSQHTLTMEELEVFRLCRINLIYTMQSQNLPMRLWYRLVLALY